MQNRLPLNDYANIPQRLGKFLCQGRGSAGLPFFFRHLYTKYWAFIVDAPDVVWPTMHVERNWLLLAPRTLSQLTLQLCGHKGINLFGILRIRGAVRRRLYRVLL